MLNSSRSIAKLPSLQFSRRQSRSSCSGFIDYKPRVLSQPLHWQDSQVSSKLRSHRITSLSYGLNRSGISHIPKRGAEIASLLLFTKLVAVSSIIYFSFRWWRHSNHQQKYHIRKTFNAKTDIHIDTSMPRFSRVAEENFLNRWFDSPPTGPIVLAGPVGVGRSYLIKSVLSDRKMTIYVDFRKEPVVTGEEYIGGFVAASGYLIPQATEIMRMFTREEQRKSKITAQEAERALNLILETLQDCKERKWVDGIPLICLDDVTVTGIKGNNGSPDSLDMFWTKFLDWCAYISDAKLAHVVIVPSQSYEPHSPLYDHPVFRHKRILLFVDYPSKERVRKYVREFLIKYYEEKGEATNPDLPNMVDWIVNCLGGQMDDLMHILIAINRGDKYGAVLRRMITDSVSKVEERLEQVLSEAHFPGNVKEDVYKKYLRLWAAMELLRDHEVVNRRDIVKTIFKEHTVELKQYVEWGIITYANQKAEIDDGDPPSTSTSANENVTNTSSLPSSNTNTNITANPNNPASANQNKEQSNQTSSSNQASNQSSNQSSNQAEAQKSSILPSWWHSDTWSISSSTTSTSNQATNATPMSSKADLANSALQMRRKKHDEEKETTGSSSGATSSAATPGTTQGTTPGTTSSTTTSNPTTTTTTTASQQSQNPSDSSSSTSPSSQNSSQKKSTLLNASLESMLVSAGSPRLRIAFDLLLKDNRLSDRKEAMTLHLQIKSIQDKLDKLEHLKKQTLEEKQLVTAEMDKFLGHLSIWREEFGQEFVEARKRRLVAQENEVHQHLESIQKEFTQLLAQKTDLEAQQKLLSVKL